MKIRTTQWVVGPESEPIFSEGQTVVEIVDEAAGEFVSVAQHGDGLGKVVFNTDEWPAVRAAINRAVRQCRPDK